MRTANALVFVLLATLAAKPLAAEEPLHQQVDQIIESASLGAVATLTQRPSNDIRIIRNCISRAIAIFSQRD